MIWSFPAPRDMPKGYALDGIRLIFVTATRQCVGCGVSIATPRENRLAKQREYCCPFSSPRSDAGTEQRPANRTTSSQLGSVAERIRRAYGRASEVIHPPVDLSRFHLSQEQGDYYVVLSRLISYKRIDLAVTACSLLRRKLLVIGDGPDRARLEAMAGPTVTFLGRASDKDVERYVSRCRALLFPGEEDFGLAPLEVAAAAGRLSPIAPAARSRPSGRMKPASSLRNKIIGPLSKRCSGWRGRVGRKSCYVRMPKPSEWMSFAKSLLPFSIK